MPHFNTSETEMWSQTMRAPSWHNSRTRRGWRRKSGVCGLGAECGWCCIPLTRHRNIADSRCPAGHRNLNHPQTTHPGQEDFPKWSSSCTPNLLYVYPLHGPSANDGFPSSSMTHEPLFCGYLPNFAILFLFSKSSFWYGFYLKNENEKFLFYLKYKENMCGSWFASQFTPPIPPPTNQPNAEIWHINVSVPKTKRWIIQIKNFHFCYQKNKTKQNKT